MAVFELGIEFQLQEALKGLDTVDRRLGEIEKRAGSKLSYGLELDESSFGKAQKQIASLEASYAKTAKLIESRPIKIAVDISEVDAALKQVEKLRDSSATLTLSAGNATSGLEKAMLANARALAGLNGSNSVAGSAKQVVGIFKDISEIGKNTADALKALDSRAKKSNRGGGFLGGVTSAIRKVALSPITIPAKTINEAFRSFSAGATESFGQDFARVFSRPFFSGLSKSDSPNRQSRREAGESLGIRSSAFGSALFDEAKFISGSKTFDQAVEKFRDGNTRLDSILKRYRKEVIEREFVPKLNRRIKETSIDTGDAKDSVIVVGGISTKGRDRSTRGAIQELADDDTLIRGFAQKDIGVGKGIPSAREAGFTKGIQAGFNLLRAQFSGVSEDALQLAAELAVLRKELGPDNARAFGFSGGAFTVTQAGELLEAAGIDDVPLQAVGLPNLVGGREPEQLTRLLNQQDSIVDGLANPGLNAKAAGILKQENAENILDTISGAALERIGNAMDAFTSQLPEGVPDFKGDHRLSEYIEYFEAIEDFIAGLAPTSELAINEELSNFGVGDAIAEIQEGIQAAIQKSIENPAEALADIEKLGDAGDIYKNYVAPALQTVEARINDAFGSKAADRILELQKVIEQGILQASDAKPGAALNLLQDRLKGFNTNISAVTVEQFEDVSQQLKVALEAGGVKGTRDILRGLTTSIFDDLGETRTKLAQAIGQEDFENIAIAATEFTTKLEGYFSAVKLAEQAIKTSGFDQADIDKLLATAQSTIIAPLGTDRSRLQKVVTGQPLRGVVSKNVRGDVESVNVDRLAEAFDATSALAGIQQYEQAFVVSINNLKTALADFAGRDPAGLLTASQNIARNYDITTKAVKAGIDEMVAHADGKGYLMQREVSEGSPGPTEEIRSNWAKTAVSVINNMDQMAQAAAKEGKKILGAFDPGTVFGKIKSVAKDVVFSVASLIGAFSVGDVLVETGRSSLRTASDLEVLRLRLNDLGTSYEAIVDRSNELGQSADVVAQAYRGFTQALGGTSLDSQSGELFESFQTSLAGAAGTQQQLENAFLALTQIAAKGRVSLEEINRQLGEALPGATAIAARALGVTQAEFFKLVEGGNLLAKDLLPRLAVQLESELGASAERISRTFGAEINRLQNNLGLLSEVYGEGLIGVLKPLAQLGNAALGPLIDNLEVLAPLLQSTALAIGTQVLATISGLAIKIPFVAKAIQSVTSATNLWTGATNLFNLAGSALSTTLTTIAVKLGPLTAGYFAAQFAVKQFTGTNEELVDVLGQLRAARDAASIGGFTQDLEVATGAFSNFYNIATNSGNVRDIQRQTEILRQSLDLSGDLTGGFTNPDIASALIPQLQALEQERGTLQIALEIATDRGDVERIDNLTESLLQIDSRRREAIEVIFPGLEETRQAVAGLEDLRATFSNPVRRAGIGAIIDDLNEILALADATIQSASDRLSELERSLQKTAIAAAGITGIGDQLSSAFEFNLRDLVAEGILDPQQLGQARTEFQQAALRSEIGQFERVRDELVEELKRTASADLTELVGFFNSRLGSDFQGLEEILTLPTPQIESVLSSLEDGASGSASALLELSRLNEEISGRQTEAARGQIEALSDQIRLTEEKLRIEEQIADRREQIGDQVLAIENQIFTLRQQQALQETAREIDAAFGGVEGSLVDITRGFLNERAQAQSELESAERSAAQDLERSARDLEEFKLSVAEQVAEINLGSANEVKGILSTVFEQADKLREDLTQIPQIIQLINSVNPLNSSRLIDGAALSGIGQVSTSTPDSTVGLREGLVARLGNQQLAAAFYGNAIQESGGRTDAFNPNDPDGGAYGLFQWQGVRRRGLNQFAAERGTRPDDLNTQLDYLTRELQTTESGAFSGINRALSTGGLDAATVAVSNLFERPNPAHANNPGRVAYARSFFEGGPIPAGISAPASSPTPSAGGAISVDTSGLDADQQDLQDANQDLLETQAEQIPKAVEVYRRLMAEITGETNQQNRQRTQTLSLLQTESRLLSEGFGSDEVARLLEVETARYEQMLKLEQLETSIAVARDEGTEITRRQERKLTEALEEQSSALLESIELEQQQIQIRDDLTERTEALTNIQESFADRLTDVQSELAALNAGLREGTAAYDLFRETYAQGIDIDDPALAISRQNAAVIDQQEEVLELRDRYMQLADDLAGGVSGAIDSGLQSLIDGTASNGEVLLNTLEGILNGLADSLLGFLTDSINNALSGMFQNLIGNVFGGGQGFGFSPLSLIGGGGGGGILSGLTGSGFGIGNTLAGASSFGLGFAGIFHGGGIVGGTGDKSAIVKGREGIFTPKQMENADNLISSLASQGSRNAPQEITLRIVNEDGEELETRQEGNGDFVVILDQAVSGLISSRSSKTSKALKNRGLTKQLKR